MFQPKGCDYSVKYIPLDKFPNLTEIIFSLKNATNNNED